MISIHVYTKSGLTCMEADILCHRVSPSPFLTDSVFNKHVFVTNTVRYQRVVMSQYLNNDLSVKSAAKYFNTDSEMIPQQKRSKTEKVMK